MSRVLTSGNSNQIDLRILREMGVELSPEDQRKIREKERGNLTPKQKFRAGVFVVIAAMRMSEMEEQWRGVRLLGEEVNRARAKGERIRSTAKVRWGVKEV